MLGIKSIVLLVAFVGCMQLATCGVAVTLPSIHSAHPNKCWWNDTNTAYAPDDKFTLPNECSEVVCKQDFSFAIESCAVKYIEDPKCKKIDQDLSLQFPDCCEWYECTDAKGTVTRL